MFESIRQRGRRFSEGSVRWVAACLAVCAGTSGCIPSLRDNPTHDPNVQVGEAFDDQARQVAVDAAASAAEVEWSEYFPSPALRALLDQAIANNQELNIQLQDLVIARAEIDARAGELWPRLSGGLGVGVEKVPERTSQGRADRFSGTPDPLGDFQFGLHASWEVDIWGKLNTARKAADARYRASVEARRFMVTALVAEIARSYYELVALDAELEILERNIAIQSDALEVVKAQKEAARATQLAVQRFEAEVLKNRSRIFALRKERVLAENRINFLVGRPPQPVVRDDSSLQEPLPAVLRVGVPSALLENRPDVRRAAALLEASKLDVRAAKKRFLPSLSIDADLGYRSFNVVHLLDTPASIATGVAAGLTAPLLNRRAIRAEYRTANAEQIKAVYEYEQTVLVAFTEVVNQINTFDNLLSSYRLGEEQVKVLHDAVEISSVLFLSARADYGEVLLTRRDALDAELELLDTRLSLWHSTVDLYQALGGGWRGVEADPKAPPASSSRGRKSVRAARKRDGRRDRP